MTTDALVAAPRGAAKLAARQTARHSRRRNAQASQTQKNAETALLPISENGAWQACNRLITIAAPFGFGFLESVYKKALVAELRFKGVVVEQEVRFDLTHRDVDVGVYRADTIVERRMIIEAKTGLLPDPAAPAELLNYLAASGLELGLVLHFGPHLEIKRVIHSKGAKPRP